MKKNQKVKNIKVQKNRVKIKKAKRKKVKNKIASKQKMKIKRVTEKKITNKQKKMIFQVNLENSRKLNHNQKKIVL